MAAASKPGIVVAAERNVGEGSASNAMGRPTHREVCGRPAVRARHRSAGTRRTHLLALRMAGPKLPSFALCARYPPSGTAARVSHSYILLSRPRTISCTSLTVAATGGSSERIAALIGSMGPSELL